MVGVLVAVSVVAIVVGCGLVVVLVLLQTNVAMQFLGEKKTRGSIELMIEREYLNKSRFFNTGIQVTLVKRTLVNNSSPLGLIRKLKKIN